ncbi:PAS domain S-box protein [Roseicella aerolata]|uniref:histidine kinase n=1 Tax=Roseicella aerolata TaxID=2883479 RepID=A0A9X1IJW1_9PROT|nr:PAS domain S-box protein [Roseicella aerolata]MCB4824973.1 PAS domain S-box protein [Roseicella aerolata]
MTDATVDQRLTAQDAVAGPRLSTVGATEVPTTPAEERFNRLTRLARRLLRTPVATVLLEASGQFLPAAQGLPEPWASLRGTPLRQSLRSAMRAGLPLLVTDMREDPRVRSKEVAEDLGIAALLAVPLALPGGRAIGALCVIDHQPRAWTAIEEQALADLASTAMDDMAAGLHRREPVAGTLRASSKEADRPAEALASGSRGATVPLACERDALTVEFHANRAALEKRAEPQIMAEALAEANARLECDVAARTAELAAANAVLRESEARFRALFDISPQMVWVADACGRLTYVNQHCADFLGLAADQVTVEAWIAALHPEDRERTLAAWSNALASGDAYETEFRLSRAADKACRWFLVRGAPLRDPDGRVERWIGVGIDIDDRRRAEAAQRGLIEALAVAVYTTDTVGQLTFYNDAAVALWGWRPPLDDAQWCGSWRLYRPDGTPLRHDDCPMALALRENRPIRGEEAVAERPDGTRVPFAAFPTPLRDSEGALLGGVNVLVDLTERKAAEAALAESEARLHLALEAGRHAFWELDIATGAVLRASFHDAIFGYGTPLPEWSYAAFLDHVLPEDRPLVERAYAAAAERETSEQIECRIRRAGDGAIRWLELHGRSQRGPDGQVVRLHGVLRDVTDRKRTEAALRESEARLRLAQEVTGIGTWEWDPGTGENLWMPEKYALFGLDPARDGPMTYARLLAEIVHPGDHAKLKTALEKALATGETYECLFRAYRRRPDGQRETCWMIARGRRIPQADGFPGRMLGVTVDITERQETEAQLQELQAELLHVSRLSAAGEMASALAHELNQPLTAATSALRAAQRLLGASSLKSPGDMGTALREAMDLAAEQALRAGQIVRRLRDFVARDEADKRLEDLRALIEEAGTLALVGARERGIQVEHRLAAALPPVVVDRIQIQQVLFNLIRNAFEAMAPGDGRGPSCRRALVIAAASAGPELVEITVADTGPGLAPDIAGRIFEAFVSTKPSGMGMGLPICRSIVEAHGGRLWAEPNPGGGTVFRFTLPVAPPEEADM